MPILSHGQVIAAIIALVVVGLVVIALLIYIAYEPVRAHRAEVALDPADTAGDGLEDTAVIHLQPAAPYVARHCRAEGASR